LGAVVVEVGGGVVAVVGGGVVTVVVGGGGGGVVDVVAGGVGVTVTVTDGDFDGVVGGTITGGVTMAPHLAGETPKRAFKVGAPGTPSLTRLAAIWKALMAAVEFGPMMPSTVSALLSAPLQPWLFSLA